MVFFYLPLPKSALPSTVLLFFNTPTAFWVKLIPLGRAQGSVFLRPASPLAATSVLVVGRARWQWSRLLQGYLCFKSRALRRDSLSPSLPRSPLLAGTLSHEPAETRQISILMCCVPGIKLYPMSGCKVEDRSPMPLSSSCLG